MKKILAIVCVGASLAACTSTEKGAGIGAVGGAILGGAISGDVRGAAVGAAVGGVGGTMIGHAEDHRRAETCYYRDRYGNRYVDYC